MTDIIYRYKYVCVAIYFMAIITCCIKNEYCSYLLFVVLLWLAAYLTYIVTVDTCRVLSASK